MDEFTSALPRRVMTLFLLVDSSGSMSASGNIAKVNRAIEEMIPLLSDISDENEQAEIKLAVMTFDSDVRWVTKDENGNPGPACVYDFVWNDVIASGLTSLGAAFTELESKLSRRAFMASATGALAPVIILLSDGVPTDNYAAALEKLSHGSSAFVRSDKGSRFAVFAATKAIKEFTESLKPADDPEAGSGKNAPDDWQDDPGPKGDWTDSLRTDDDWNEALDLLCRNILRRWYELVDKDCRENPFTPEEVKDVPEKYRDACNPNVKQSQAFNEYESDGYASRSPGFYPNAGTDKYGSLFFSEMYEKDNGELVALGLYIFILSDDSIQMGVYYDFKQYPEPDAVDREIPTQEELKEAGVDKVYTAEDLRMAKAWIAARDKVISGVVLSGIDLMKPTGIADLGMYLEGVDGLYFNNGGEYTDSYSDDVLRDYGGDEGIYLDFCGFDIHDHDVLGRIEYRPQGSQLLSNYRGKGSLSIDVKVVETTKNAAGVSAIMPDMLCQLLGSDREALLRGLGVSQEMLDWRNKNRDENGIMYELFGRSDPWYWGENHIIFSRFVEGTDGGTVCIEVGIDIPEDGKGFERAVITYTYY